jgi:hypothetical protein
MAGRCRCGGKTSEGIGEDKAGGEAAAESQIKGRQVLGISAAERFHFACRGAQGERIPARGAGGFYGIPTQDGETSLVLRLIRIRDP